MLEGGTKYSLFLSVGSFCRYRGTDNEQQKKQYNQTIKLQENSIFWFPCFFCDKGTCRKTLCPPWLADHFRWNPEYVLLLLRPHKKSYRNILSPWVPSLDRRRKLLANWLVEFWRFDLSPWFVLKDPKPYMKSHRWSSLFLSLAHEVLERKCWCTVFARRLERTCLTWQLLISRENTPGRRGYRWCYTWCSRYNHLILASFVSVSKYWNKTRKSD